MKIGFISEPTANAYYRAFIPLRELERRGHTVLWPPELGLDLPLSSLYGCDIVHCYRRFERMADLKTLSAQGVAISFDNDDNFAAAEVSEQGRGFEGHRYNKAMARAVREAVRLADLTTTPSEPLARHYREIGAREVQVIENRLERTMLGFGDRGRHGGITVGWVAAREHQLEAERMPIELALQELLDAYSVVRVITIGVRLHLRSDRYEHVPEVRFRQLLRSTSHFDLGIAPLLDTPFNRSRSDVKLKEYASGGTPWLASPVGPYDHFGPQQGGMLVSDDDWFTALVRLIDDARGRRRLARRALRWAKGETIERHGQEWEDAFQDAITRRASASPEPT